MTWREIEIGELGKIVTGKTPPTANREMYDGDYMFVTPTDLDWQSYYVRNTHSTVTQLAREKLKNQFIPANSTVFTCIGNTIGKCGLTSEDCLSNQQINSVIPSEQHDPRFVYYLLNFNRPKIRSIGLSGGAAQPIINKTTFSSVKVSVPETKAEEEAISEALSAYDDLIENNRRRISLLEEATRLLYREWFVYFRFPGHEHVKVVDGVPEGWKKQSLGEVSDLTWGDTNTTKASYTEHGFDAYSAAGLDGKLPKFDYEKDGIVLSAIGAQCGKTWLARGKWSCIKNTIRIFPSTDELSVEYLFFSTFGESYWPRRGAAQPFISQGDARRKTILIPSGGLMENFTVFAFGALTQTNKLRLQNIELAKARDLLLPRLMDGRLEVAA